MTKPVVISAAGQAVAVAVPEETGVRFVAVKYEVWGLDGKLFASVRAAEAAATRHIQGDEAEIGDVQIAHIAAFESWRGGRNSDLR